MQTKEELMGEKNIIQPKDMNKNEAFDADVKMATLEVLIDIRDIFAEEFLDEETRKKWDEQGKNMARKTGKI
ncbi:MAG TPA: hypothetical protein ENH82_10320 [bacterium]|nr:hypothetical protein [bacterium]